MIRRHRDLEQVRALIGRARIDTMQISASIRPPELERAVSFDEEQETRKLAEANGIRTRV